MKKRWCLYQWSFKDKPNEIIKSECRENEFHDKKAQLKLFHEPGERVIESFKKTILK